MSGFVFGLVAEFQVFKWNEHPAVSFGAFITPPVLLGWLALSPGKGALAGLVTLAAATLGHFVGAQFTAYEQNDLEYRGWVFIAVVLGLLLGLAGQKIRSRRMVTRALAASVPAALLCVPVYLWFSGTSYYSDHAELPVLAFDVASALLLLVLCRGVVARVAALLCVLVLLRPLVLLVVLTSPFLWYSGGGI